MRVKIKRLTENAVIPSYAKDGDAGLDLVATSLETVQKSGFRYHEYGTGLAIEIPEGYVGLIFPRSSISTTINILANAVGVIDSGYRGEIKLRFKLENLAFGGTSYSVGSKIGQLIIMPYPKIELVEVLELASTERGDAGFGSTGN